MATQTITAQAIIKAQDQTSGVFASIAGRAKAMMRSLAAVSGGVGSAQAVRAAANEAARQAGQISARNRARADAFTAAQRAAEASAAAKKGAGGGIREYAGHAAAWIAGGVGGLGAYELARRGIEAQARAGHERVRMQSAGMDPAEILHSEMKASELAKSNPAFDPTSIQHLLRNARSIVGSYEEAAHIMEPLLKLRTVALGANPGKAAELNEDFDKLIKGLEIKGVTQDMPKFIEYLDGMAKAINTFGDTLRSNDYYEMFKYGRQSTQSLSKEYTNMVAPTLAQELGGASAGVAQAAFFRAIVGGKMSNLAVNELNKIGLIDPNKIVRTKTGNVKGVEPGGIRGSRLAGESPYEWVQQYLLPALHKAGVTDPHDIQERIARVFSNQVAAQLVSLFATQQSRIEKDKALSKGARGLEAADDIASKDPKVAWEALQRQVENLASSMGAMETAASAMNSTAKALAEYADGIRKRREQNKDLVFPESVQPPIVKDWDEGVRRLFDQSILGRIEKTREALESMERNPATRNFPATQMRMNDLRRQLAELVQQQLPRAPSFALPNLGGKGGFGVGGAAFGFGPNGIGPSLNAGKVEAVVTAPVTAQLTGSAEGRVTGKSEITLNLTLDAGTVIRRVDRIEQQLSGVINLIANGNGPGSTGRSSPDTGSSMP